MAEAPEGAAPRFLEKKALDLLCVRLRLSQREGQIVRSMFRGGKEVAVARQLEMSPHTLRTHVERLYRKLGVTNRMELVVCLYESFLSLTCESGSPLPLSAAATPPGGVPL